MIEDSDQKVLDYIKLREAKGVGRLVAWRLIRAFGGASQVFERSMTELSAVEGMTTDKAKAVLKHDLVDIAISKLSKAKHENCQILSPECENYPEELQHIIDPPLVLYVKGCLLKGETRLGVVGTRYPSITGLKATRYFARELGAYSMSIVSGLARGIDIEAHRSTLDRLGRNIAVLGSGFNKIYPREHEKLANQIVEHGALVSEYDPDCAPEPHHFPERNRIISALSKGLLVVEAPERSGALITANLALEQGKDVFVIPGDAIRLSCKGSNQLIKEGAFCVTEPSDIAYHMQVSPVSESVRTSDDLASDQLTINEPLWESFSHREALTLDELANQSSMEMPTLLCQLASLEKRGVVKPISGQRWVRTI